MIFDNSNISLKEIEELEHHYLMKYWYFLKFAEDELVQGLRSMRDIKKDWEGKYGGERGLSQFDVGCERIVYALLNGKIAGKPNSSPVSSDLFFEVEDAYIHIDLKSVTTNNGATKSDNIGDFNTSIFIGENQNSYKGYMLVGKGKEKERREYNPNLPTYYKKKNGDKKITLTYFITLLNNEQTWENELISIMCMPNGKLIDIYGPEPLKAGKNPGKTRFNFKNTPYFRLLDNTKRRVRIIQQKTIF